MPLNKNIHLKPFLSAASVAVPATVLVLILTKTPVSVYQGVVFFFMMLFLGYVLWIRYNRKQAAFYFEHGGKKVLVLVTILGALSLLLIAFSAL